MLVNLILVKVAYHSCVVLVEGMRELSLHRRVRVTGKATTMRNKVIQVIMAMELLEALEAEAKRQCRPRSSLVREACQRYLRDLERRLDKEYEEGYRRVPEDTALAESQVAMLGEVLAEETW